MRLIAPTDDLETCLMLRTEVFVDEQNVPPDLERDALDDVATHFLACILTDDGERPVGTARVVVSGDTGKIGRVCVRACERGSGLGGDLIESCLAYLRTLEGVKRAELGAQLSALDFYRKLGFTPFGEIFDDAGIPHQMMERPLATPSR